MGLLEATRLSLTEPEFLRNFFGITLPTVLPLDTNAPATPHSPLPPAPVSLSFPLCLANLDSSPCLPLAHSSSFSSRPQELKNVLN